MLDQRLREVARGPLRLVARPLARAGVRAGWLTAGGLAMGSGAAVALAVDQRWLALALWLGNRLLDGLDGVVAREQGATDRGALLDILADFAVYAGFVVGLAVARPEARLAAVVLLAAYYVSGAAFLAWSSLAERRARVAPDERSLHFVGGLAEGAETIVAYSLLCVWPRGTEIVVWTFAALVGITALQRVRFAWGALSDHGPSDGPPGGGGPARAG